MPRSERALQIVTGVAATVAFVGLSAVGIRYASGHFDDTYNLTAAFDAAGQGLIKDSDVKVRGVNIGKVTGVALEDGRAVVTMEINGDEQIPSGSRALVRPKTLFGEKFVDVEIAAEGRNGPFLGDGDRFEETVGSFELEEVLVNAQELLEVVDAADVSVIVDTLAEASRGQGPRIRAQIENWSRVTDVFARHDADTRQFLDDFERLAASFERSSDDLLALSRRSASALPSLNDQADRLDDLLDDAADVSRHFAELFEREQGVFERLATDGGKTVAVLYEHREEIPDVVRALRDFTKVLAQAGEYKGNSFRVVEGGEGRLASIKLVAEQHTLVALVCSLTDAPFCPLSGAGTTGDPGGGAAGASSGSETVAVPPPPVTEGVDAVNDVLGRLLYGVAPSSLGGVAP